MARLIPSHHLIQARVSTQTLQRIEHYCEQFAMERTVFCQTVLIEKIQQLDEKEAYLKQLKKHRSAPTTPRGLGIEIKTTHEMVMAQAEKPTEKVSQAPEKLMDRLRDSFKRYCDYLDGAENPIDRSIRLQTCLDDLRQRTKDPMQAHEAFLELQDMIKNREALIKGATLEQIPDEVTIEGDVD